RMYLGRFYRRRKCSPRRGRGSFRQRTRLASRGGLCKQRRGQESSGSDECECEFFSHRKFLKFRVLKSILPRRGIVKRFAIVEAVWIRGRCGSRVPRGIGRGGRDLRHPASEVYLRIGRGADELDCSDRHMEGR